MFWSSKFYREDCGFGLNEPDILSPVLLLQLCLCHDEKNTNLKWNRKWQIMSYLVAAVLSPHGRFAMYVENEWKGKNQVKYRIGKYAKKEQVHYYNWDRFSPRWNIGR